MRNQKLFYHKFVPHMLRSACSYSRQIPGPKVLMSLLHEGQTASRQRLGCRRLIKDLTMEIISEVFASDLHCLGVHH